MSITAMKQAVEAMLPVSAYGRVGSKDTEQAALQSAITALRTAIAEAEKVEPVAWQRIDPETNERVWDEDSFSSHPNDLDDCVPLFLAAGAQPAPKQEPPPDSIAVNLMRLAGLDKHMARECEVIVRQIYAAPVQEPKGLFIGLIESHEGLAEELAAQPTDKDFLSDQDKIPENCGSGHCSCIECVKTCAWTPMDSEDMPGTYDTACGQDWTFVDGGVEENNFKFCHGCGKPVEVKL